MKIATTRIAWVDALKGFAILMVVLGHILQRFYSDDTLAVRFIYSFHVPLFMFLSGYVSYKIFAWNSLEKRFWQLIVPFFSAIVLDYLIHHISQLSIGGLCDYIVSIILRPDKGLWFLWALFFINILFVGCRKVASAVSVDERIVVLGAAGILNLVELLTRFELFGYHWIAWYFIFFAIGAYWRIFDQKDRSRLDRSILIVSAILFPILAGFFRMHNQTPGFYRWINLGPYFPILYRIIVSFAGIAFFVELFKFFCKEQNVVYKQLIKLGGGFGNLLPAFVSIIPIFQISHMGRTARWDFNRIHIYCDKLH